MQTLKDKMYNYEVTPPSQSWQIIATELNKDKSLNSAPLKRRSKIFYLSLSAAAAILLFAFGLIFWENSNNKASDDKITAPKAISANKSQVDNKSISPEDANMESGSKYITITGPQGECVKISSKAAKLIVASDNQNPPKPVVWSAKVNKWKDIMESNVFAPATANFLDVVELTHALKTDN